MIYFVDESWLCTMEYRLNRCMPKRNEDIEKRLTPDTLDL